MLVPRFESLNLKLCDLLGSFLYSYHHLVENEADLTTDNISFELHYELVRTYSKMKQILSLIHCYFCSD